MLEKRFRIYPHAVRFFRKDILSQYINMPCKNAIQSKIID